MAPLLHGVVSDLERERGERLEFSLRIETLAVDVREVGAQSPRYAPIAGSLMADDDRYRRWLRELLS